MESTNKAVEDNPENSLTAPPILVVEDNPDNYRLAEMILKHMGYQVVIMKTGKEALLWCEQNLPKLILMDISLPELSGVEVTQLLKEKIKFQKIPIVAMTAHAMREDKENLLSYGFDHYLGKPYQPQDLIKLIKKITEV